MPQRQMLEKKKKKKSEYSIKHQSSSLGRSLCRDGGASSHILFFGFGGSSGLLSCSTVPSGGASVLAPSPAVLSFWLSSAILSISAVIDLPCGGALYCWSLAPEPPPPTRIDGADMPVWNVGIPPVALGLTMRLVGSSDGALLWLARPSPPAMEADAPMRSWMMEKLSRQRSLVGRYRSHQPGP